MINLRDGVTAQPAPPTRAGRRARLLFDPLRHRYFRFDADAMRRGGTPLRERMRDCELLLPDRSGDSQALAAADERRRETWLTAIVHRYLFVRVPLARPDLWLDDLLPLARPLMGPAAQAVLLALAMLAIVLLARHWDPFVATFAELASPLGAFATILALVAVKSLHELAHALSLKRRGGRVPTFGVAFVVLFPVLYTDTSDAWMLPRARDRLAVDLAGVRVELAMAVLATLTWIVLPDGGWRLAAFSLAAVSWAMSLVVNLNPFMRFDGYHVLADALDLPNMQERAFALARWRLREMLFARGLAPPERLRTSLRRALVVYAWATWIYRLVVFTGIALLVYHAAFKLLGLVLFAIEIWWFVLRPLTREVGAWGSIVRTQRARPRTWMPLALFAIAFALLVAPLDTRVALPATLETGTVEAIHAPRAATLLDVPVADGEIVAVNGVVAQLAVDEFQHDRAVLAARLAAARGAHRTARLGEDERSAARRVAVVRGEIAALERRAEALTLRASRPGRIVRSVELRPGMVLGEGAAVVSVASPGARIVAYASEREHARLVAGASARLVLTDPTLASVRARVVRVADLPLSNVSRAENRVRHGGGVRTDAEGRPLRPTFRIRLQPDGPIDLPLGRFPGVVHVDVEGRSFGAAALRRIAGVLLRESGF